MVSPYSSHVQHLMNEEKAQFQAIHFGFIISPILENVKALEFIVIVRHSWAHTHLNGFPALGHQDLDLMSETCPWMGDVIGIEQSSGKSTRMGVRDPGLSLEPATMTQGTKFTCLDLEYLCGPHKWFSDQGSMEGF